ncbi:hypothetical protein H072_9513 [Dactylellina haptotyla CBS 200.50]|uniref:Transcription factor domain-containing protein n=1 Tax=Dactylellina haptotyla (strain CBS 200.50) TaxID=1284197 RepID=S8A2I3_DACHA|nr:hypothetical protein H072_9513 [Dactylellina haptotyla CBS 200.50]
MAVTLDSIALQPHLFEMSSSSFPSSLSFPSDTERSPMPPVRSKSKSQPGPAATTAAGQSTSGAAAGVTKPKQSKSRNGEKRGVPCGGYKKDFKWRAFEESDLSGKGSKPRPKPLSNLPAKPKRGISSGPSSPALSEASLGSLHSPLQSPLPLTPLTTQFDSPPTPPLHHLYAPSMYSMGTLEDSYIPTQPFSGAEVPRSHPAYMDEERRASISPKLEDLLIPGSILNRPIPLPDYIDYPHGIQYRPTGMDIGMTMPADDDQIEEIPRNLMDDGWIVSHLGSPEDSASTAYQSISDIFRRPQVDVDSPEMLILHFDKQTCGIMSIKDGPTENPWRTLIWPLATQIPALRHAIYSMTAFHMSHGRPEMRVQGMEHMKQSIRHLAAGLSSGDMLPEAALATTLSLAFAEEWDRHISTGIEHLRGAKVLVNQALIRYQNYPVNSAELTRLRFLYNVWVYIDVLARLTSTNDNESHSFESISPLLSAPMIISSEVDPLMGCATTLFPLIGRCASLAKRVRKSKKNSVTIISTALELKTAIENWQPDAVYEPIEDQTSNIDHCIQTAEAYRWAALLYLHQAVPEIPSPSSHELAEKVMCTIASIPTSSRTCIVHAFPLLAAGCEAVGQEEREWIEKRWENLMQRLWIGNIDRAWDIVREIWNRRDNYVSEKQTNAMVTDMDYSIRSHLSSNGSTPAASGIEDPTMYLDFQKLNDDLTGSPSQSDMMWGGNVTSEIRRSSPIPGSRVKGLEMDEWDYETSIRGRLSWVGLCAEWQWEIFIG